jgi:hypothetical protein
MMVEPRSVLIDAPHRLIARLPPHVLTRCKAKIIAVSGEFLLVAIYELGLRNSLSLRPSNEDRALVDKDR